MRTLPPRAQFFVGSVCSIGGLVLLSLLVRYGIAPVALSGEFALFAALGILAGTRKVNLIGSRVAADVGSMSLSFIVVFAAILRVNLTLAVLTGFVTTLSGCLYPKRQPVHQLLFNLSLNAISTYSAAMVFVLINGGMSTRLPESLLAVALSCLTFYFLNTGFVSVIVSMVSSQRATDVWYEKFLWTAPSYFVGALVSLLASLIAPSHLTILLLGGIPVALLTFKSYEIYTRQAHEMKKSKEELAELYLKTIRSLALAIDAKDAYTHQHILRVQRYAVAIARAMGPSGSDLEGVNTGALLHDIGKLGVPEYVLLKPGKLTDEEFAKIKEHPRIGAGILAEIEFPWPVLPAVKYHHEKWDGTGYPDGLKGEAIPLQARILAVADVYDALTSSRAYREAWSHQDALQKIVEGKGTHFDPAIVDVFVQIIDTVLEESRQHRTPLEPVEASISNKQAIRAVRDIQRASSELWALYEVANTLSSSLGLNETLNILANKLVGIFSNVACLFLMRDESSGVMTVKCSVGLNAELFYNGTTAPESSISSDTLKSGTTYNGPYSKSDIILTAKPGVPWVELQSALIAPIVHQNKTLGTLNLYHTGESAFSEFDMHLLEQISSRSALAIYNGLLFERTQNHANTDGLTNLFNLRYITDFVENKYMNSENSDRFILMCLDLDWFKPINDIFGHQEGDRVLRDLSKILRTLVRESDIVARYGGDEFLIVLDRCTKEGAERLRDQIATAIHDYDTNLVHPTLGRLRLGVSIGLAHFPEEGNDWPTLLSVADKAMFAQKAERKLGRLVEAHRDDSRLARAA